MATESFLAEVTFQLDQKIKEEMDGACGSDRGCERKERKAFQAEERNA